MKTTTHFFCQEPVTAAELIPCFILGEAFLKAPGCSLTADVDIYKQEPSSLNNSSQITQRNPKNSFKYLQPTFRDTLHRYSSLKALPID